MAEAGPLKRISQTGTRFRQTIFSRMDLKTLKALCTALATSLSPDARNLLEALADKEAKELGFNSWTDALHWQREVPYYLCRICHRNTSGTHRIIRYGDDGIPNTAWHANCAVGLPWTGNVQVRGPHQRDNEQRIEVFGNLRLTPE